MSEVVVRPFEPEEWPLFRDLRLAALKDAPGMYASSYAETVNRTPEDWRAMLTAPGQKIFGVFDGETPVALSAIFTWREDPGGETALVAMGYVAPSHRGRGLSHLFHAAQLAWLRTQPRFKRAIVGHRASNTASRGGIVAAGFIETHRATHLWPDGTTEDEVFYCMETG